MNKNQIKDWKGRCHCCREKRTPEQLTSNNGMVCQTCVDKATTDYEKAKKVGKINSPILWCQDCQSQFKIFDAKHTGPFRNYNDFDQAVRAYEGIPYKINALWLARWKCNCKNRKPILTVGMPHTNWADGYIKSI